MKFCMQAKYNVFCFGKFETQLRLLRTDKKGLLGGRILPALKTTVACCRFSRIKLYSTHGYLPTEDTTRLQQRLQELRLGINIAISTLTRHFHDLDMRSIGGRRILMNYRSTADSKQLLTSFQFHRRITKASAKHSYFASQLQGHFREPMTHYRNLSVSRKIIEPGLNYLHATGTFMCPRNASVLRDGHVYVPADVVQSIEVNSEAKRAFGVNPCLLSSNKCRPHLSTYITRREGRKGRC